MRLFGKKPGPVRAFSDREIEETKRDRIRRFNEVPGGSLAELQADLRSIERARKATR